MPEREGGLDAVIADVPNTSARGRPASREHTRKSVHDGNLVSR
ncbi:hypothetical protein ACFWSF_21195 [Streptomyces sp. NPDC058611]